MTKSTNRKASSAHDGAKKGRIIDRTQHSNGGSANTRPSNTAAPTTPAATETCTALTKKGKPCRNKHAKGSRRCALHQATPGLSPPPDTPAKNDTNDEPNAEPDVPTRELIDTITRRLARIGEAIGTITASTATTINTKVAPRVEAAVQHGAEAAKHGVEHGTEQARRGAEKARRGAEAARRAAVGFADEHHLADRARAARHTAAETAKVVGEKAAQRAKQLATEAQVAAKAAAHAANEGRTAALKHAESSLSELSAKADEARVALANRARAARVAGLDFYGRHRDEILALLLTAVKVVAVIGVRRLTASPKKGAKGANKDSRPVAEAIKLVTAISIEIGRLLAKNPAGLPMLRERFRHGDEAEQAVIGMVLGPALSNDPEHAARVILEFLEAAESEPAADTIARRTLAPLMEQNPQVVDQVKQWVAAKRPLVQRAALIALERHLSDRRSPLGDVLAAAVVVLEDHDEEVRQALRWLLESAADIDLDTTAKAVSSRLRATGDARARIDDALPDVLRDRLDA